jgi:hypothetical protein
MLVSRVGVGTEVKGVVNEVLFKKTLLKTKLTKKAETAKNFDQVSNELSAKQLQSKKKTCKTSFKNKFKAGDRGRTEILTKFFLLYFTRRRDITPLLQL